MVKTTNTTKKTLVKDSNRVIIHAKNLSEAEERGVIKLYNELVPSREELPIDVQMIVTEAFPKFEETIGKESFDKVKKYFGIGDKLSTKATREFEIKSLIAKLRTIENAQYYIIGYKELIKDLAGKLCNAPEGMTDLEKAKIIRMFFIVLADNETFLEDYVYNPNPFPNSQNKIVPSETKALSNNKFAFGPEELFNIYAMKAKFSEGYYYDMMIIHFKRMYFEYQSTKNKYKNELVELLEFSELKYDGQRFTSVNKCMAGVTFGQIRKLKQRIHQVRGFFPMETFCNKKMIKEKMDITDLYVIYKTLIMYPWKTESNKKEQTHRTICGSRFIDKKQMYYEIFDNFLVADEAEAERWICLFEYVSEHELVLKTQFDGNGELLPKSEFYNAGILSAALNYAMDMRYISKHTMVIRDFEVVKKLFMLEGAEDKFLKLKRGEVKPQDMRELLGIDEDFENNVLQIKNLESEVNPLVQSVIKFALDNGYADSEEDIDKTLIENVFIPGNEENIIKFSEGKINDIDFEKRIGFEVEFAESYFDTSKIDIKEVEARLQEIKRSGRKEQMRKSKLLVSLYCYVVKNGIGCGPKNKPAKRNKGLKPEILEKLIS